MLSNTESLKFFVHREILENFRSAYDFAQTFEVDYQNVCKWYRDFRKMPIKTALEMSEYLNMRLVVYRGI